MADKDAEIVQFGCLRCKRTRRTEEMDAAAEQIMLQVFEGAFYMIQQEGQTQGIVVDDTLKNKLMKWGIQASILPKDALKRPKHEAGTAELANEREKLD